MYNSFTRTQIVLIIIAAMLLFGAMIELRIRQIVRQNLMRSMQDGIVSTDATSSSQSSQSLPAFNLPDLPVFKNFYVGGKIVTVGKNEISVERPVIPKSPGEKVTVGKVSYAVTPDTVLVAWKLKSHEEVGRAHYEARERQISKKSDIPLWYDKEENIELTNLKTGDIVWIFPVGDTHDALVIAKILPSL